MVLQIPIKQIKPMLCKLGKKEDLSKKGFIFEPKLDGTRALCYKNKGLKLINRRNKNITEEFPEFDFINRIKAKKCILDGEIIVYDKKGNPSFNLLQKRAQLTKKIMIELRSKQYPATYVVFDILMKDNKDLTKLPLTQRKKILEETIEDSNTIEKVFYTVKGKQLWKKVIKRKLEGVIAKKKTSKYYPGKRSQEWLKIKNLKTIDCLIAGYTQKKRIISALVLAIYDEGELKYLGKVGTGFTEKLLENLRRELKKIESKKAIVEYEGKEEIKWVKPKIVCEVKYLEFSKKGIMRAPVFLRIRDDKEPRECTLKSQVY